MRFTGGIACISVALDCWDKAKTLFAAPNVWLWWVIAGLWGINALAFCVWKPS